MAIGDTFADEEKAFKDAEKWYNSLDENAKKEFDAQCDKDMKLFEEIEQKEVDEINKRIKTINMADWKKNHP